MKIVIRVRSKEIERGWHGIFVEGIEIIEVAFHERLAVADIAEEKSLTHFQVQIAGGGTTLFNALTVVKQIQKNLLHEPCPLKLSYIRIGTALPIWKRGYSPLLWNEILDFCMTHEIELAEEYLKRQPIVSYKAVHNRGVVMCN